MDCFVEARKLGKMLLGDIDRCSIDGGFTVCIGWSHLEWQSVQVQRLKPQPKESVPQKNVFRRFVDGNEVLS